MAMSDEHRAALRQGRAEAKAIRVYLNALSSRKPGRPPSRDGLERKIGDLQKKAEAETDPLKRVELIEKRIESEQRLSDLQDPPDMSALEEGFVSAAASYSGRKGITYSAWREGGVPAAVLKKAGIKRSRS